MNPERSKPRIVKLILLLGVLAIGEYAYISLAPYPPERRAQKIFALPVLGATLKAAVETQRNANIEEAVRAGDVGAAGTLYYLGKEAGDQARMDRAIEVLRASDTATAEYDLYFIENGFPSREDMMTYEFSLLRYRVMKENLRMFGQSDDMYRRQSEANERTLRQLYRSAAAGDERSKEIVAELEG